VLKSVIALLSVLAISLLIFAFVGFGPAFATQLQSCQSTLYSSDQFRCLTTGSQGATIGYGLYLTGVIAAVFAWIVALITAAAHGRWGWGWGWGWVLVVLLLSPLGSLLYALFGLSTHSQRSTGAHAARA
jgi:hypothetical protein